MIVYDCILQKYIFVLHIYVFPTNNVLVEKLGYEYNVKYYYILNKYFTRKKNLILFDCLESERNANEKIMGLD